MKISYNWLKELVDLNISPEETAKVLTGLGIEVSGVTYLGKGWENVVIAGILAVEKHPNADKLSVCKVTDGKTEYQIVCGAPNVKAGKKAVLALVGASLPNGVKIEPRKIRKVESCGMLCSAQELKLENYDTEDGIILLDIDSDKTLGIPAAEYFGVNDYLLELELTANRGDCLSHLGIARELAAGLNKKVLAPSCILPIVKSMGRAKLDIVIDAPEFCKRYRGQVLSGIKVKQSPMWIQNRLRVCGIRPINSVVDATNYVLLETGHALHAFDYAKITGEKVVVRWARDGEKLLCLDGKERVLSSKIPVIADAVKPVAIAGVMGGELSAVNEKTNVVLLECAYFAPASIRLSRQLLQMNTEASYRFERGVDWNNVDYSAQRVISVLNSIGCVEYSELKIDTVASEYNKQIIELSVDRVNDVLGTDIKKSVINDLLIRIGCEVKAAANGDVLKIIVPAHRNDITQDVDLIEEIARLNGYDNIPVDKTYCVATGGYSPNRLRMVSEKIRVFLTGKGFYEAMNYSFIPENDIELFGVDIRSTIWLANPVSKDQIVMRPLILPGLMKNMCHNIRHQVDDVKLFELGYKYTVPPHGEQKVEETYTLAVLVTGEEVSTGWDQKSVPAGFGFTKGIFHGILKHLGIDNKTELKISDKKFFVTGEGFDVTVDGNIVGYLGKVNEYLSKKYDAVKQVYVLELELPCIFALLTEESKYAEIPRFPTVRRDLSIIVNENTNYGVIESSLRKAAGECVVDCKLFDRYSGEGIPQGMVSYSISVYYNHPERTLTKNEVEEWQRKVVDTLKTEYKAVVRGEEGK
ncbi:MAG: phenylalanine--tRNA ligase subunit beta [Elusimicrobiota bacterium]